MAASSAQDSAPVIVNTPAAAHATSSQPGAPTNRDDSAETRKIPDPIIDPITIIVASKRLRPRTRCALSDWRSDAFRAGMETEDIAARGTRGRYCKPAETSTDYQLSATCGLVAA